MPSVRNQMWKPNGLNLVCSKEVETLLKMSTVPYTIGILDAPHLFRLAKDVPKLIETDSVSGKSLSSVKQS